MSQPIIDTRLLFRGTTPMAVIAVNGLPLADALQSMPPAALESTTLVEPKRKDFRKKPSAARRFVPAATALGVVEAVRAGEAVRSKDLRDAITQIEDLHMVQSAIIDVTQQDLRAMHTLLRDRKTAKSKQRRSRERPVFDAPAVPVVAEDEPLEPFPDLMKELLLFVHARVGGSIETAAQVLVTQIPELETRLRRDGLLVT